MSIPESSAARSAAYPHTVKFYNDDRSLGRTVADFLEPGLRAAEPAIVIATAAHRMLIATELTARGINLQRLEAAGDVQILDADEILGQFMSGSNPDAAKFHLVIDQLIERACKGRRPCPVRAYGEMVDVLWKRGNSDGAIRLEIFWNRVSTQAQFSLLCGYAVGTFTSRSRPARIAMPCAPCIITGWKRTTRPPERLPS
jgi:hypothetical protein